ncbi:MAG: hypothetical protein PHI01_03550 [Candidatus Izemoplasmatales bacterium]|nr:hypothetical protein [Candidatus Izemoplasmatales bacterium]
MISMEIANYLEKIRYGRKMSQEAFVEDVCSLRQYQRYRSGECEITYDKIERFAIKLGIPTKNLMREFEQESVKQYNMIDEFYNSVVNNDRILSEELRIKLENDTIFGEERQMYFIHALTLHDYYLAKISKEDALMKTSDLVNYPTILKQNYFTDVEILILSFILSIIPPEDNSRLLKKLTSLFDTAEGILSGENDLIYALILMRLTKSQGIQKNNPKVIQLCDIGIQRGIRYKQYYLLEYFFYYKALAHFKLEEYSLYEDALFRCYNVLHMEGNAKKIEKFTKLIEDDFKIAYDSFIMKYLMKNIL